MPNTSIERCIEVLIATFGALAGFALIRFLTLTPPTPLQLSDDFGWVTAANPGYHAGCVSGDGRRRA
jgi:hypothetical protein